MLVRTLCVAALATVPCTSTALARPREHVVYAFRASGGVNPFGPVIDLGGALYGTTKYGGPRQAGTIFRLLPPAAGQTGWTQTVLHCFTGVDGGYPIGVLIGDGAGALYGTSSAGGGKGFGTVWKLTPPAIGQTGWTQTILLDFDGANGSTPIGGLTLDGAGAIYGTTREGGPPGLGIVFKLSPPVDGGTSWTPSLLHVFSGTAGDGAAPQSGSLLLGSGGALYGSTYLGGTFGFGTVFRLAPPAPGQTQWTETILHAFTGAEGAPISGLITDQAGALYGVTLNGGAHEQGTVFELAPPSGDRRAWTETILHSFTGTDGAYPFSTPVADADGALFGTTSQAGPTNQGTVFKLAPPIAGHPFRFATVLHAFVGGPHDGARPSAGLAIDSAGTLYGTTVTGGPANTGAIIEIRR